MIKNIFKSWFRSSIKEKWYLQGKLLKSVYLKKLEEEKKDPVQFCNRFAEEVGKECIKSQIASVEFAVARLEQEIDEKKQKVQDLQREKDKVREEIAQKYDIQLQQLKERKQIYLTVDMDSLDGIVEASRKMDARVDAVFALAQEAKEGYEKELSSHIQHLKSSPQNMQILDLLKSQFGELKQRIDQKIAEEFSFPEAREVFKQVVFFVLFLLMLVFDFLLAYKVMAEFLEVGTSKAKDIPLPFVGVIPAGVAAVALTLLVTLVFMLFFHVYWRSETNHKGKKSLLVRWLAWLAAVLLFRWVGQSWIVGGYNFFNLELFIRLMFVLSIFIGEYFLEKINRNVLFDLCKKIWQIPVKMAEYIWYIRGNKNIEKVVNATSVEQMAINSQKAEFIADNTPSRQVLDGLAQLVTDLKSQASFIFSSYESEIRGYQDQITKIENDKFSAIRQGTEDLSQNIRRIEDVEIPKIKAQINLYKQKINERI